jgi:hypothetical protein
MGMNHRLLGRDDADVLAFGADQSDFRGADPIIDTGSGVARWRRVVRSAGYGVQFL